ncbi:hypothetical protein UlMin_019377 [Ulmus minor]
MESASCSILHTLRFSSAVSNIKLFHANHPCRLPPFRPIFPRKSNFPGKSLQLNLLTASCSLSSKHDDNVEDEDELEEQKSSEKLAVLIEVEGVLMDVYRLANREAFNTAFRKLGLDCANWPEPVYLDLLRRSLGDEESMLIFYFDKIGWPSSLPTSEKESFVKAVLREKGNALHEVLVSQRLPLRPGVQAFIDDAYDEGIPVVVLTAYSKNGEKNARFITEQLGPARVLRIKIIGNEEVEQSMYGRLVSHDEFSSGVDEQLAKEAKKAVSAEKQRIAEDVASVLKLSVGINTSSSQSLDKIIAALRAGAESVGVPVSNCVLIAGSQSGVTGAERVGMPCIVLRGSLTSRAEFPSAKAVLDGFGGADLSLSKLRQKKLS